MHPSQLAVEKTENHEKCEFCRFSQRIKRCIRSRKSAEAGSADPSPGEKTRGVDHHLVARQRTEALAVVGVPRLPCAILRGREQHVASAAVKHQLNARTALNAEHGRRCHVGDQLVSEQ